MGVTLSEKALNMQYMSYSRCLNFAEYSNRVEFLICLLAFFLFFSLCIIITEYTQ